MFPTSDFKTNMAWNSYPQNKKKKKSKPFLSARVLRNIVFHISTDTDLSQKLITFFPNTSFGV